jgi:ribokinase
MADWISPDGGAVSNREFEGDVVTVIGAAVVDHIYGVDHIPVAGEAVPGSLARHPGGKGLTRAVAAARLGLSVRLISAVGDDHDGDVILDYLRDENVDTELVKVVAGTQTASTSVMIPSSGIPAIIGCGDDRVQLSARDLRTPAALVAIASSDAVLLTFEPPTAVVEQVLTVLGLLPARPMLIVHPAPRIDRPQYLYQHMNTVDYLMGSNRDLHEMLPESTDSIAGIAQHLRALGVGAICAVENFRCRVWSDPVTIETPPFPVALQGSPGAHAAFAAALVSRLLPARRPAEAQDYTWACAAMVATQSFGDVPGAMPRRADVDRIVRMEWDAH